ncbi:MAG: hypothetical protein Kow00109_22000 [Acidobacteriota bacterium]
MSQGQVSPSLPRLAEALENLRRNLATVEQLTRQIQTEVDEFVDRHHLTPERLLEAMAALETAETQAEFLQQLTRQLAAFGSASLAWLADAEGRFRPWHAEGIPAERWSSCTPDQDPAFLQAVREGEVVEFHAASGAFPAWLADLGVGAESAVLLPLRFGDRCPAVFLVAAPSPLEVPSLLVFLGFSRMLLQNRRLLALVGEEDAAFLEAERWPAAVVAGLQPETPVEELEKTPAPEAPVTASPEAWAEPHPAAPVAEQEFEAEGETGKLEEETAEAVVAAPAAGEPPAPERIPPEPERPQDSAAPESASVAETVPAPELPPELEELHEQALRFARLLVTEIKLYNEEAVAAGRQSGDLYRRLREDIDRSREMYEKRVDPAVKEQVDYLHEELVRILCGGDAGLLGPDYPGPVMRTEFHDA